MYRMHILYMTFIFYTSTIFAQENGQGIELESGRQFVQRSSQGSHQENKSKEFLFSGQLSTWGQFTPDIPTKTWMGGRYIPPTLSHCWTISVQWSITTGKSRISTIFLTGNTNSTTSQSIPSFIGIPNKSGSPHKWAPPNVSQAKVFN